MEPAHKSHKGSVFNDLLDVVYPPVCFGCDRIIETDSKLVCDYCWSKAVNFDLPYCSHCMQIIEKGTTCPVCDPGVSLPIFSLGQYINPLQTIIHQFKYSGYSVIGTGLGERLFDKYYQFLKELKLHAIVPIPLHSYRLKARGFNQAQIIAETIGRLADVASSSDVLIKIRKTKDQAKLGLKERMINMKGAFAVEGDCLRGKRLMVVDDVITTGSTVAEAVRVLKEAGTYPVAIATAAIAGQ